MPCFRKDDKPKGISPIDAKIQSVKQRRLQQLHARGDVNWRSYRRAKKQKGPIITHAFGAEALEKCRFGPDVLIDHFECTPLPLWNCNDDLPDYNQIALKTSNEIIPVSPTGQNETSDGSKRDSIGLKAITIGKKVIRSPPMNWNPSLTALEEDEFEAEAALIPEHFKLAYCLPLQNERDEYEKAIQTVQILRAGGQLEYRDRVRVILKETETMFHFSLEGRVVLDQDNPEINEIKQKNEKYLKVCQLHAESDAYANGTAQTFLPLERQKYTQLVGAHMLDKGLLVNDFIMFDDYKLLKDKERLAQIQEERERENEEALRKAQELQEANEDNENTSVPPPPQEEDDSSDTEEEMEKFESKVDWKALDCFFEDNKKANEKFLHVDMNDLDEGLEYPSDEELNTTIEIDALYNKRMEQKLKSRPKLLPNISYSVLLLERIASTTKYQKKHMDVRGFEHVFKRELTRRQLYQMKIEALVESGPVLKRFWAFRPNMTKGLEVTSIATHPSNGNIIAASYGNSSYPTISEDKPPPHGIICIWNLKNINFPEKTFHFENSSATKVAFSNWTPYMLAIGLMDGSIYVYDIRMTPPRLFCSTEKMLDRAIGPIWDLLWIHETEMASSGSLSEVLIAVSDDGVITRWSFNSGFESTPLLKVRRCPLKLPGRREKRAEALLSQCSATYTLCFYPDDPTLYLIGTEEGFIHKCTTAYTEQFMSTYISHTGPVYSIKFSPYAKDIFVSCGGDWTVNIWQENSTEAPLLSISTGLRTVFDVAWDPWMCSVLICTNERHLEIWDVSVNKLEPIIHFKLPNFGLRCVTFYNYVQGCLVGDNDGGITLYALRNFPDQPEEYDDKITHLMTSLIPGYTKETVDKKKNATIKLPPPPPPVNPQPDEDEDQSSDEEEEQEEENNENTENIPT